MLFITDDIIGLSIHKQISLIDYPFIGEVELFFRLLLVVGFFPVQQAISMFYVKDTIDPLQLIT